MTKETAREGTYSRGESGQWAKRPLSRLPFKIGFILFLKLSETDNFPGGHFDVQVTDKLYLYGLLQKGAKACPCSLSESLLLDNSLVWFWTPGPRFR